MAVTIKDIANVAGVSHATVSRALGRHPRISDQTIQRIQAIADELGYVPHTAARGLKTRRSSVLGVIVRRIDDPFFSEVLQGIEDVLHDAGYSLFLAASHRDPARERAIMQAMGERRVEGVIVCSTQIQPDHLRQLDRFRVPLVLVNNQAVDTPDVHSVYHDDAEGSAQLTCHLLDLGHRRLAYLGNARGGKTNAERVRGFQTAVSLAGLTPHCIIAGPNGQPEGGAAGMRKVLELSPRCTAVVCYNDMMAIGAIQTAVEADLQVPADISVTGFDNIELAAYVTPNLTTFHQPKLELGWAAARMMLRVLAKPDLASPHPDVVTLRGKLITRRSTSPPRPE